MEAAWTLLEPGTRKPDLATNARILSGADIAGALLAAANLRGADLLDTKLRQADFTGCKTGKLPGTALMTLLKQAS